MNIFTTDIDPVVSAQNLDDKRINKMILECAQMLCTAVRIVADDDPEFCDGLYKVAHKNHPCSIWARKTKENFLWLLRHAFALSDLKEKFTQKRHKSTEMLERVSELDWIFPDGDLTEFPNCTVHDGQGVNFKHIKDPHVAYKKYLTVRWKNDKLLPTWNYSGGICPSWAHDELSDHYQCKI